MPEFGNPEDGSSGWHPGMGRDGEPMAGITVA